MNHAQAYLQSQEGCPYCGPDGSAYECSGLSIEGTAIYQQWGCHKCSAEWTASYHLSALITDDGVVDVEDVTDE